MKDVVGTVVESVVVVVSRLVANIDFPSLLMEIEDMAIEQVYAQLLSLLTLYTSFFMRYEESLTLSSYHNNSHTYNVSRSSGLKMLLKIWAHIINEREDIMVKLIILDNLTGSNDRLNYGS